MRVWFWILVTLIVAGCVPLSQDQPAPTGTAYQQTEATTESLAMVQFDDLGLAPEWKNKKWLNTENPLWFDELSGSVVLLEMWTLG